MCHGLGDGTRRKSIVKIYVCDGSHSRSGDLLAVKDSIKKRLSRSIETFPELISVVLDQKVLIKLPLQYALIFSKPNACWIWFPFS